MTIYKDLYDIPLHNYTASIGFFDGVHKGHRFLIDCIRQKAAETRTYSAVITFTNHPKTLLHPEEPLQLLNTPDEKMQNLASTGLDACFALSFTPTLRNLSACEFIQDVLARCLHVKTLLIGYDHKFGHNRTEDFHDYVRHGAAYGMQVLATPSFEDGQGRHYSSSAIRQTLLSGDVTEAATLLGQPYQVKGVVVNGHHLGRTFGFPTANLAVDHRDKLIPACGVYAVRATLEDGTTFPGMLNIGTRPTLSENDPKITLETHLFGFEGNLYGQSLTLSFVSRLRNEIKQPSIEALQAQLIQDREAALKALS